MNRPEDRLVSPLGRGYIRLMSGFFPPLVQRCTYLETFDLLLDLAVGVVWFTVFTTLFVTGTALLITLVGLPILTATLLLVRVVAALERGRARLFLGTQIETPAR